MRKDITFKISVGILTASVVESMKSKYLEKDFDDYLVKLIKKTKLERLPKLQEYKVIVMCSTMLF